MRLFSERLQDIPQTQTRVVATATLRLATNADEFLAQAQQILGLPIQVISGEEEAHLIYQGVAHTTGGPEQRLVVDIAVAVPNWRPEPPHRPHSYSVCPWDA